MNCFKNSCHILPGLTTVYVHTGINACELQVFNKRSAIQKYKSYSRNLDTNKCVTRKWPFYISQVHYTRSKKVSVKLNLT